MDNTNDIILSEGDNEFLNLIRTNRERRYKDDTTKSTGKGSSSINPIRLDSGQEQGDRGESGRSDREEESKESSPKRIRKRVQEKLSTKENNDNKESSNEENVSEENYTDEEITDNTLEENPLETTRSTKEENFRNIRNALKASRNRVSELETQLAAKDEELKKLDEVSSLQAELEETKNKLATLQKYEDIIGLYGTEGFKEEYYDKVDKIKEGVLDLAKDYGVDGSVIDQAMTITNQRQLNEYLGQYFDVYSVQDIRKSIKEMQDIISKREEAEANPVKTREFLLSNFAKKKDAIEKQSKENIKLASLSAWQEISNTYSNPASGIDILQEKNGNKEHNDTRLGILNNSSKEFGKLVAILSENGLTSLPSNVARALASRFQLGETAAFAIVKSEQLQKENDELRAELKKFTNYQRPLGVSGSSASFGKMTDSKDLKGRALHEFLYNKASKASQELQ
jgi:DNA repair exonuclease SbcCD ATPase subunit